MSAPDRRVLYSFCMEGGVKRRIAKKTARKYSIEIGPIK
jgi:hypothetical protein